MKILVVDDNRSTADALARVLRKQGDEVEAVYDGATAIARMESTQPDLVLTDLKMEPVDGMEVLKAARALRPPIEVIVFTAFGAVDIAVRAIRKGARDFLTKPVTVDEVSRRLEDLRKAKGGTFSTDDTAPFIANSPMAKALLNELEQSAGVPSPVWIEGEIGSGRAHAAMTLHRFGNAEDLFSIHDVSRHDAWPEKGTVLLPAVDNLPLDLQRQLHRQLAYLPSGVRLIATAGIDGRRSVAEGNLLSELYYALAVVVIHCPPLRQRREDILPLVNLGLTTFATRYHRARPDLSPEHAKVLEAHTWPGNTRELLNLAERAVVIGAQAFDIDAIDPPSPGLPKLEPGFSLSSYLESVERQILVESLRQSNGDRIKAGRLLGVERNTLRYKLNKYGLLEK